MESQEFPIIVTFILPGWQFGEIGGSLSRKWEFQHGCSWLQLHSSESSRKDRPRVQRLNGCCWWTRCWNACLICVDVKPFILPGEYTESNCFTGIIDTLCRHATTEEFWETSLIHSSFFQKTQFLASTRKCVKNFLQRKTPSRKSYLDDIHQKHGETLGKDPGSRSLFTNPRKNAGFIRWNLPPSPAVVRVNLVSQSLLLI